MAEKFEYNVKFGVGDFHLIFSTLQDKQLANEKEMKEMTTYENLYDAVISDVEKYHKLEEENKRLYTLRKSLYDQTNEQLKERHR